MTVKRIQVYLIVMSIVLTLVVLTFSGGINIASYKQNYTKSLLSSYHILAGETVRKIEYAVQYGKPLTNFYGIERLLLEKKQDSRYIEEVFISLPFGSIIYNQDGAVSKDLPESIQANIQFHDRSQTYESIFFDGKYYLFLPIREGNQWIGSLGLVLTGDVVSAGINTYTWQSIIILAIFGLLSALIFIYTLSRFSIVNKKKEIDKRKLLTVILSVLGVIQVAYGVINYVTLHDAYKQSVSENTEIILQVVKKDIEHVIQRGVTYQQLHGMDIYLNNIVRSVPEISRIALIDQNLTSQLKEEDYFNSVSLMKDFHNQAEYIATVELSNGYIQGYMREMLLDTATIVIISILTMVEAALFFLMYVRRKISLAHYTKQELMDNEDVSFEEKSFVRTLAFFICSAVFISASFLPIYLSELYHEAMGMSKLMFIALPISLEFTLATVSFLLFHTTVLKKGWKTPFLFGAVLIGIGSFFSWVAWDALSFILSRAIVGFGFGLTFLSMRSYVLMDHNSSRLKKEMGQFHAGVFTGMYTGIVVGALLAERIGFTQVFIIAIAMAIVAHLFAWKLMNNRSRKTLSPRHVLTRRLPRIKGYTFLFNREVSTLFFLIVLPLSIAGMFLYYFFPVYAEEAGLSTSNIGRAFLLNGLGVIYLGPWLNRKISRFISGQGIIFLGGLMVSFAIFLFAVNSTILNAYIATFLLGLALSLALYSQLVDFINHRFTQSIGEVKALRYFSTFERLGQILGPILFASIFISGFQEGLFIISFLILILATIFFIVSRFGKEKENRSKIV